MFIKPYFHSVFIAVATVLVVVSCAPVADPKDRETAADTEVLLASILDEANEKVPGVILRVSGPDLFFDQARGFANLETRRLMRSGSTLRIGSITKTYLAALTILAERQGLLALDDSIGLYLSQAVLDALPDGLRPTLRQLLNHTSGVPDYYDARFYLDDWKDRGPLTTELVLHALREKKATTVPGQAFAYSNTNYHLLALILESVHRKPLVSLLEETFLGPLGLSRTYYGISAPPGDDIHGYGSPLDPMEDTYLWQENTGPDGGMFATAEDLEVWLRALFSDRGSLADVGEIMLSDLVEESDRKHQGYGAEVLTSRRGWSVVGHTGGLDGYLTAAFYAPLRDTVLVLHMNKSDENAFSETLGAVLRLLD